MDGIPTTTPPLHSIPCAAVDQVQLGTTSPCDKRVYVNEQHKTQVGHLCTPCTCMCRSMSVMKNTVTGK